MTLKEWATRHPGRDSGGRRRRPRGIVGWDCRPHKISPITYERGPLRFRGRLERDGAPR